MPGEPFEGIRVVGDGWERTNQPNHPSWGLRGGKIQPSAGLLRCVDKYVTLQHCDVECVVE